MPGLSQCGLKKLNLPGMKGKYAGYREEHVHVKIPSKGKYLMTPKILIIVGKGAAVEVYGIPVIRRLVFLAKKLEAKEIFCLFLPDCIEYRKIVSDLVPPDHFASAIDFLDNGRKILDSWFEENEDVIVLQANIAIDRLSFSKLLWHISNNITLLVDPLEKRKNQAMAVKVPGNIPERTSVLEAMIKKMISTGSLPADIADRVDIIAASPGLPYPVSEDPTSVVEAEKRLMDSLGLQTAETDGFMARNFDRHISRFFSKRLVKTGLHPNWFTIMGMSIGLLGAWFISQPGYSQRLLGSLLFVFCIMVDGVDGEIARLTLKDSTFGHYFDIVTDNIVHAAIFVALPVSFYRETGNNIYLKSLWILLIGVAFAAFSAYYCIFRVEHRYNKKILTVFDKLASRDFAYLIALLALINKLQWFLWGATFGSYLFGIILWILYLRSSSLTRGYNKV